MGLPNPIVEREVRTGQEGFVHYLLTCLLLGDRPRGGNHPSPLSQRGMALLTAIDDLSFQHQPDGGCHLLWEMQLDRRHLDEGLRYPDLGIVSDERLLLFELKTQPGSVREGQVEEYLERGLHLYPTRQVDLIYLTRDRIAGTPPLTDRSRYANITWDQVAALVDEVWPDICDEESALAHALTGYLRERVSERTATPPRPTTFVPAACAPASELGPIPVPEGPPSLEAALAVAALVLEDGIQRVYEYPWPSRDHAVAFRGDVRDAAQAAGLVRLDAWVWRPESTGKPLTVTGLHIGIELRLSRLSKG